MLPHLLEAKQDTNPYFDLRKHRVDNLLTISSYTSIFDRKEQMQKQVMEANVINEKLNKNELSYCDQEFLIQIKKYILSNINSSLLKNNLLAKYLNVSTSTLERKVKALTNISPGKLIMEIRLDYAKELITSHLNINIVKIAHKVGFKSASAFSRSFKKKYNLSPVQLRKKSKNDM